MEGKENPSSDHEFSSDIYTKDIDELEYDELEVRERAIKEDLKQFVGGSTNLQQVEALEGDLDKIAQRKANDGE